jgi:hypothetical protein
VFVQSSSHRPSCFVSHIFNRDFSKAKNCDDPRQFFIFVWSGLEVCSSGRAGRMFGKQSEHAAPSLGFYVQVHSDNYTPKISASPKRPFLSLPFAGLSSYPKNLNNIFLSAFPSAFFRIASRARAVTCSSVPWRVTISAAGSVSLPWSMSWTSSCTIADRSSGEWLPYHAVIQNP